MFRIFKNEDSLIIFILGVILFLIGIPLYFIEHRMIISAFLLGYSIAWINLGLYLSKYKEIK